MTWIRTLLKVVFETVIESLGEETTEMSSLCYSGCEEEQGLKWVSYHPILINSTWIFSKSA